MTENTRQVAAVDLGSNSFHMLVARVQDGQVHILDRIKEMVRLAAGLDEDGKLSEEAMERALTCLTRFGQRLRDIPRGSVRIVGTNTLRRANNAAEFIRRAEAALGHSIDIIAGREEARLIYLGVAHTDAESDEKRLVVDIGGGSTELIIGRHASPLHMESVPLGCVTLSQAHFADGRITKERIQQAMHRARLELRPLEGSYRHLGWQRAIGSSGSAKSLASVSEANGWSTGTITRHALERIRKALVKVGELEKLDLGGLTADRIPVFVGGYIVMHAVFEALDLEEMHISEGALREGLIYEMVGADGGAGVRQATLDRLSRIYAIDLPHTQRVAHTLQGLFDLVSGPWALDPVQDHQTLMLAAQLHEIGLAVAHNDYHTHGAYLIEHSDLPGFSRREQLRLASLIYGHRRRLRPSRFEKLPMEERPTALRLTVLLRLAVLLHRNRSRTPRLPALQIEATPDHLSLRFPPDWLERHPLTLTDLEREREYLTPSGFSLEFT
ncbi:MAG: exopolyphosphatase [Halothiobacillaceae bacterium]|jgi:exopolyphosphatase/guanosine-5'-triphosphate,3'-diphosphate pyrophosphatase|nr:exopolyphosphatase [Halothiobacillaceae bacterium]MDY0049111.1 exopolyphosphatase [Halothiobacillaceae bacterium]